MTFVDNTPNHAHTGANEAPVLVEHLKDGVSRIILNRPKHRNAMNHEARVELLSAFKECRSIAKVIILTGRGEAFCAGMDLKEKHRDASTEWLEVQEAIRLHSAIVIASVNGFALGGGTTLVNVSDLAVAAEEARFGLPELTFGVYPAMAGPSVQLRLQPKRAAWMTLTGEQISGRTAEEWGMVNYCVPLEELEQKSLALAARIASFDAVALEYSKRALWQIPYHVSDWTSALEFGVLTNLQIESRRAALQGPEVIRRDDHPGLR